MPLTANTDSQNVLFVDNRSYPPSRAMSRDVLVIFLKKMADGNIAHRAVWHFCSNDSIMTARYGFFRP